jgi:hypothetical protein
MPRGFHASLPNEDVLSSPFVSPSEHFMAFQQAANKGTLVPGQTISINKYTVQVERYLSQGLIFHPSFNDSDPL